MPTRIQTTNKSFTLIELLVVVAVMGLLTTLGIVALNHARAKARDVRRVADLDQFSTAMEMHFNGHNAFPNTNGVQCLSTCEQETPPSWCPDFKEFIKYIPEDPMEPSLQNCYLINSDGENYRIAAHLEKDPDKMRNDGGAYLQFYEVYSDPTTPLLTGWNDPDTGPWQGQLGGTMITALDSDLVGHWSLAESDEVVGSRDALGFDGVDDYVEIPNVISGDDTHTISFWANPLLWQDCWLDMSGDSGYSFIQIFQNILYVGYSPTTINYRAYTENFIAGNWYHFAFVKTGTGDNLNVYINGILQTSYTGTVGNMNGGSIMYLGKWHLNTYQIKGSISEVRIYNTALSEPQVGLLYNGTDITEGLVSHWKLDEEDGTIAEDSFGDNDGTLNGGPYWTRQTTDLSENGNTGTTHNISYALDHNGAYNGAMSFDGADDYVDTTTAMNFGTSDSFSVSAWINTNSIDSGERFVMDRTTNTNSLIDLYRSDDDMLFRIRGGDGAGLTTVTYANILTVGNWYHVVGVRNVATDILNIYVNGVNVTPVTDATTAGIYPLIRIGSTNNPTPSWNGSISDVRIYDRALDEDEVRTLYLGTE